MSFIIPIDILPNQKLSVTLEGFRFDISLKSTDTSTLVTIARDDELLIENIRSLGGTFLIPFEYLEGDAGNFFFEVQNEEIIYFTNFGITQRLIYLTAEEVEEIRESA